MVGSPCFFTGDHEPFVNPHAPCTPLFAGYQVEIDRALNGVDALIVDCTYTEAEYPQKAGWGHGPFESALALTKRVGAKDLYCTHHLPTRSDDELEAVFVAFLADQAGQIWGLGITLAYEGLNVTL